MKHADLIARERAHRNLRPHAEARLAMVLWSDDYAYKQRGGSMDFWDSLPISKKRLCREAVTHILKAAAENGRALQESDNG